MILEVFARNALLAFAAALVVLGARRCATAGAAAPVPRAEVLLRTLLVAALVIVWAVYALGLGGQLGTATVALTALLFLLASLLLPAAVPSRPSRPLPRVLLGPALLTLALLTVDLAAHLPLPPTDWDAMTYHLYLPLRWLQEGRLVHVPTVFGDNAAAYAPQNGALFFAWILALAGRDAVVNVSQLTALVFLALALYRLARLAGAGREPATLAALLLPWLGPVRHATYTANVDLLMTAAALGALAWAVEYRRRPASSTALLCGLAAGLAAGTKTVGLPLAALVVLPLLLPRPAGSRSGPGNARAGRRVNARDPRDPRAGNEASLAPGATSWRALARLGLVAAGALLGGGFWYLRNAWHHGRHHGNPLFPLALDLGPWRLPGAYDRAAIEAGEFHLDGAGAVIATVLRQFGAPTCALVLLGLGALAVLGLARRGRVPLGLFALAVAWTAFFVWVVPHNNQARFLLPVLALAVVGGALVLDRVWRRAGGELVRDRARPRADAETVSGALVRDRAWRRFGTTAVIFWLAAVAVATLDARPWQTWRLVLADLAAAERSPWLWLGMVLLTVAAAAAVALGRRGRSLRVAALALLGASLLTIATGHADLLRPVAFARADYRGWSDGYLPFNRPGAPSPAKTIAYTGANIPYALTGGDLARRVLYVNTQGAPGDSFHDFWRRDPRRYPYHKPALYRGRDDYATWLANLERQNVELVVIFRLHWAERRTIRATPAGFPVESAWARRHPERFEPLLQRPVVEVYRLRPASSTTP